MKLSTKDIESLIQQTQSAEKTSAISYQNMQKMQDYKGFTLEPIPKGWNIVLHGKKHTLFVAGPSGLRFTEDMREARIFYNVEFCKGMIDEVINDHNEWIKILGGKPILNKQSQQQQCQNAPTQEQIRQQQQQTLF